MRDCAAGMPVAGCVLWCHFRGPSGGDGKAGGFEASEQELTGRACKVEPEIGVDGNGDD